MDARACGHSPPSFLTGYSKFQYNVLPMGIVMYGYILQSKSNEILGGIEILKTYIDDILVINKGAFADHVEQLIIWF